MSAPTQSASAGVTSAVVSAAEVAALVDGHHRPSGLVVPVVPVPADDPRWAELAAPFPVDEIEKLPKALSKSGEYGTCQRPDRNGYACGGWHKLPAIHLDYVGHAGITARLNAVDPHWSWRPAYRHLPADLLAAAIGTGNPDMVRALAEVALPAYTDGGLWIELTVLGHTRLGFGDAEGKSGPSAVKELIGDALRNGAMRCGVGTYLWSKSDAALALARGEHQDSDGEVIGRGERARPDAQQVAAARRDARRAARQSSTPPGPPAARGAGERPAQRPAAEPPAQQPNSQQPGSQQPGGQQPPAQQSGGQQPRQVERVTQVDSHDPWATNGPAPAGQDEHTTTADVPAAVRLAERAIDCRDEQSLTDVLREAQAAQEMNADVAYDLDDHVAWILRVDPAQGAIPLGAVLHAARRHLAAGDGTTVREAAIAAAQNTN